MNNEPAANPAEELAPEGDWVQQIQFWNYFLSSSRRIISDKIWSKFVEVAGPKL